MSSDNSGHNDDSIKEKTQPDNIQSDDVNEKKTEKVEPQEIPRKEKVTKTSTSSGLVVALIVAVSIASFFAGTYFSNLNSDVITKSDLDEAISKLESKIQRVQQAPSQAPQPVKISLDDDPIRGDPNAPITIIEFSDFQCPFCARFHTQTLPLILKEYIDEGKVNLVYRDFPIQSIHPNALPAAVAAECANEQGKYWEYHDMLFEKQTDWSRLDSSAVISTFNQYAKDIGLQSPQFDSCLESGKYLEEVQGDLSDGRDYDITGTPGFFIGNDKIGFVKLSGAQPFESFKKVIDEQLDA